MPVYRDKEGVTTEWEDLQYQHGNKVGKYAVDEHGVLEAKMFELEGDAILDAPTEVEMMRTRELVHRVEDDDEDEEALEELRRRRLAELHKAAAEPRFGSMRAITRDEYVPEVTGAPRGVPVVLLLFESGHEGCGVVQKHLSVLASRFPKTKFLQIKSTDAIPNFPAAQLPAALLYYNGQLRRQLTGKLCCGGADATLEKAEMILAGQGFLAGSSYTPKGLPPLEAIAAVHDGEAAGEASDSDSDSESDAYRSSALRGKTAMRF